MRRLLIAMIVALGGLVATAAAPAQPAGAPAMPNVPTTRVLAIGTVAGAGREAMRGTMAQEVGDTVKLYLAGKIDQWFVRRDRPGVVFLLNATSVEEARAELAGLPLTRAGIMTFDLIPLGPLAPLGLLGARQ